MKQAELERLRNLDDRELKIYELETRRSSKNALVAYLLFFFLGGTGAHQYYLGKPLRGLIFPMPLISFALMAIECGFIGKGHMTMPESAMGMMLAFVFIVSLIAGVVFWFLDLFTLVLQCRRAEEKANSKMLKQLS